MFKTKISPQLKEAIEIQRYAEARYKAESTNIDLDRDDRCGDRAREELDEDNVKFWQNHPSSLFNQKFSLITRGKGAYIAWLEGVRRSRWKNYTHLRLQVQLQGYSCSC